MDALLFVNISIESFWFLLCRMLRVRLWALGIKPRTSQPGVKCQVDVKNDFFFLCLLMYLGDFKGTWGRMSSYYICIAVLWLYYLDSKTAILVSEGV